jgi:predicted ATPase
MLTRLRIRNFKKFDEVDIELGANVVFVGPNNSGKSSALQALSLWELGLRTWLVKRSESEAKVRTGVTINRRDVIAAPIPAANLLWRDLHTRDTQQVEGKKKTENVRIEIGLSGVTNGEAWECALEFDYANPESVYCRPRAGAPGAPLIPPGAIATSMAFLQPMSGLAANEVRIDAGAVDVRIGEGKSAEVLRNLCFLLLNETDGAGKWRRVTDELKRLFGVELQAPEYLAARGELTMAYRDHRGVLLDIGNAGRGLQQTLLLLAYLHLHAGKVLLLDEPDAHLEFLRQSQIYRVITDHARATGGQVIVASHSEVVLNEAADKDVVVAFVGRPHRIDDRGSQVMKSLKHLGFEQYLQAEQAGWVLYVEGATDVEILRGFAQRLGHPAAAVLERPFFHAIGTNKPALAREHFFGLREALPHLQGVLLVDHLDKALLHGHESLRELMWERREIENYLMFPEVLEAWAANDGAGQTPGPLFAAAAQEQRTAVMRECIGELVIPLALKNRDDPWWHKTKATDEFLDRLFDSYFKKLGLPNLMRKSDYHTLVPFLPPELIAPEVREKLDAIVQTATRAQPMV